MNIYINIPQAFDICSNCHHTNCIELPNTNHAETERIPISYTCEKCGEEHHFRKLGSELIG